MSDDEDARRDARRAQLLAALNPQSGPAREQSMQQQQAQAQQVRDLSQMRPVVQQSVSEQERKAMQVVSATFQLFKEAIVNSNDPALRRDFRESSLNNMMG